MDYYDVDLTDPDAVTPHRNRIESCPGGRFREDRSTWVAG